MSDVNNSLRPSVNGYEYLFIFIAGMIGDIIVHFLAYHKITGAALMPYYNDLRSFNPINSLLKIFGLKGFKGPNGSINATFWGAFFGGVACLIGLLIAHALMFICDEIDKKVKGN